MSESGSRADSGGEPSPRALRVAGRLAFPSMVVLGACLAEFPDPMVLEGFVDPTPRFDFPVVWVSKPEENAFVKRSVLFTPPGLPVHFDGEFTPGYELHLLAARVETPNQGFHILKIPVTDSVSPGPAHVRGTQSLVLTSERIRLKLRLRDRDNELVSIDSVTLRLR